MLSGAVDDPGRSAPELPEGAATAILRALRPAPADRFADVKSFAAALSVAA
jgi:hypothetical protein